MRNHLYFKSDLADDGTWTDDGKGVVKPPGLEHSRLLAAHLSRSVTLLATPWNEEDFGWEFLTKCDGIRAGVLTSSYENGWLVIVIPVTFFGFLRRRRIHSAIDRLADDIESFLIADARFRNVQRYSATEFEAQARATPQPFSAATVAHAKRKS